MNVPRGLYELKQRFGPLVLGCDPRESGHVIESPAGWESDDVIIALNLWSYTRKLHVNSSNLERRTRNPSFARTCRFDSGVEH